jgi:TonB-dependent SusC/RagA subfamily outer membrane receptor
MGYYYRDRLVLEASMSRSSPQFPDRTAPAITLLAIVLSGLVPACARRTGTPQARPQVAAAEDTITAADLTSGAVERRPREPIGSLLQGRVSGVNVTVSPAGVVSVRLQGASSFYSNADPLIVIDGTSFSPGPGGTLIGVNPEDIESIEVLKHPPETSLYGVRGANGVIVITTKRPKRD